VQSVTQQVRPPGSGDRRRATGIAAVAVVAIAIALLKPWGSPAGAPAATVPAESASPASLATVTPEPRENPDAEVLAFCLDPAGWRVYATQRWGSRDFTSWTRIDPVDDATGPLDRSIPVTPLVTSVVKTLGWCAPTGSERPPAWTSATIYRVRRETGGVVRAEAITPPRVAPELESPIGAVYGPPRPRGHGDAADGWPGGRYVFRLSDVNDRSTYNRWFAIQIELVASATP
jgi:hypothetical protein